MKIFFANPRSATDAAMQAALAIAMPYLAPGTQVTLGRDEFEANFSQYNSIKRWAESIAARYDGIVVMPVDGEAAVGSATAEILNYAFARSRPILVVGTGGVCWMAKSIHKTTGKARDGWRVSP